MRKCIRVAEWCALLLSIAAPGVARAQTADLVVSAFSGAPAAATTGQSFTVSSTVNTTGAVTRSFSVGFYLSADATVTTADVLIGSRTIASLSRNASSTATTTVRVPPSLAPGSYTIGAIADTANVVAESNETNNARAGGSVQVSRAPVDLTITALSGGPAMVMPGAPFGLTCTVAAAPTGAPGAFVVGFYISADSVITTSDLSIGSRPLNTLGAGGSSTATSIVTVPIDTPTGTYRLGAIADSTGGVVETNEGNNSMVGPAIQVIRPDVSVASVSGVPPQAQRGASFSVTDSVANAPFGIAVGPFTVSYVLLTDPDPTSIGLTLAERSVSGLASGASSTATTMVSIPEAITYGTYFLAVVADSGGLIPDADVINNAAVLPLQVQPADVCDPAAVDDGNPCTVDTCDPVLGVTHTPAAAGSLCSDGNYCNGTETCDGASTCLPGLAPAIDDGNSCTADTCDPVTGVWHVPLAAGVSCSDGNACNGAETCSGSGACIAGAAPVLDDGNPCTVDACSPLAGVTHTPAAAGTSCSDGNACNGSETCNGSAVCVAGVAPAVDDGNPCTADACDPVLGVTHTPAAAGTSCSDGNACNGAEACNGSGVCVASAAPALDDGNPCTVDACDPVLGVSHAAAPAGTLCAAGTACSTASTCNGAGECISGTPVNIDDGNPCTADSCDPLAGVTHVPAAAGASCADGDVCNGDELCDGAGVCRTGTPLVLDDGLPCTLDTCDPVLGVGHVQQPSGAACSDGNLCHAPGTCSGTGACLSGPPLDIDDHNPCTADCCDPAVGVSHTPVLAGTSCSDGNACNGAETCDGQGACLPGEPPRLTGNTCLAMACDPSTGVTQHPVPAGTPCNDFNACTHSDRCDGAGYCAGIAIACVSDTCTSRTCNGTDTCTVAFNTDVCDDGNACTAGDRCDGAGACAPGAPVTSETCGGRTGAACPPGAGVVAYTTGQASLRYDRAGNLAAVVDPTLPTDPPSVGFSMPPSLPALVPAQFLDQTTVAAGCITTWTWDFGDGTTSSEQNPVHAFGAAGDYSVTLTVLTSLGIEGTAMRPITVVGNQPPVASFTFSPAHPFPHDVVTFTDTSSDPDDGIVRREWRFGSRTSTASSISLVACGDMSVDLIVYDRGGQYATYSVTVPVTPGPAIEVDVVPGEDLSAVVASQLCPGDSIRLGPGQHAGGIVLQDINVRGAGAGVTIVSGHGSSWSGYVLEVGASAGKAVTIQGMTVASGGVAGTSGGGIAAGGEGTVRLLDLEVRDNVGQGGIRVGGSAVAVEIRRASVHHNVNDSPTSPFGGGIGMACCSDVSVTDSEIAFNQTSWEGGGAGLDEGARFVFSRNYVHHNRSSGRGGGLWLNGGRSEVFNNRFVANEALGGGGAYVSDAVFAGNLVAGNVGGGVLDLSYGSSLTIVNSTIADNVGNGIDRPEWAVWGPLVVNSIVTGNTIDVFGSLDPSSAYNLVSWPGPVFVGNGDYRLAPGSEAVDAGYYILVPPGLVVDLFGSPRIMDGLGSGYPEVDIGCAEAQGEPLCGWR